MSDATRAASKRSARIGLVVAILAGALMVGLGILLAGRFGTSVSVASSALIGKPLPDVTLPYLEEEGEISFSDYRGDILVINFWASWCLACREEHPALIGASNDYADAGVTFIGVNTQDTYGPAVAFLDDMGRGENWIYVVDEGTRAGFALGVLGVPETFFVDRDGTIVGKISGPSTYALLARTLDNIILGRAVDSVRTGEVQNR